MTNKDPSNNNSNALPEGAEIKLNSPFSDGCVIVVADKVNDVLFCGETECRFKDSGLCPKHKSKKARKTKNT